MNYATRSSRSSRLTNKLNQLDNTVVLQPNEADGRSERLRCSGLSSLQPAGQTPDCCVAARRNPRRGLSSSSVCHGVKSDISRHHQLCLTSLQDVI